MLLWKIHNVYCSHTQLSPLQRFKTLDFVKYPNQKQFMSKSINIFFYLSCAPSWCHLLSTECTYETSWSLEWIVQMPQCFSSHYLLMKCLHEVSYVFVFITFRKCHLGAWRSHNAKQQVSFIFNDDREMGFYIVCISLPPRWIPNLIFRVSFYI